MTEEFDKSTEEINQWDLSKFGVERNQVSCVCVLCVSGRID